MRYVLQTFIKAFLEENDLVNEVCLWSAFVCQVNESYLLAFLFKY